MKFLVRYYNKGDWYSSHIHASCFDEAGDICKRHNLQLAGEHKFTLSWPFGWIASLFIR